MKLYPQDFEENMHAFFAGKRPSQLCSWVLTAFLISTVAMHESVLRDFEEKIQNQEINSWSFVAAEKDRHAASRFSVLALIDIDACQRRTDVGKNMALVRVLRRTRIHSSITSIENKHSAVSP